MFLFSLEFRRQHRDTFCQFVSRPCFSLSSVDSGVILASGLFPGLRAKEEAAKAILIWLTDIADACDADAAFGAADAIHCKGYLSIDVIDARAISTFTLILL